MPQKITAFNGVTPTDLKDMPVDFAQEVIELWKGFADSLKKHCDPAISKLGTKADDILTEAINGAKYVRVNEVTAHLINERKKDGRLDKAFSIPQLPWE